MAEQIFRIGGELQLPPSLCRSAWGQSTPGAYSSNLWYSRHWTLTQVSLSFTINVFFIGVGTVIGGMWMDSAGPRKVATVGGIIYGLGYALSSFATAHHSLPLLYLCYGVLAGTGGGMGYICPVATSRNGFRISAE